MAEVAKGWTYTGFPPPDPFLSLEISRIKKGAAAIHIVTPPPVRTGLPLELKN